MSPGIPSILIAVVLALPLPSPDAMPAQGKGPDKMELYTAGDNTFALYKPPGWNVDSRAVENGKVVTVSDSKGSSRAVVRILSMRDRHENSTALVSRTLKDLRATVSGLDLAWARSTVDRRRAVIEFRYTGNRKNPMRARYYFNAQYPDATVFGYEASEKEFGKQKPLLLSVLANFTILDPSAASGPPGASIAGFIASTISFWGPSRVPYFNGSRIQGVIHSPYCRPVDALILAMKEYGSRNHKVLERAADPARAGQTAAYLKRGADVETASLSFDSRTGVRCKGVFDVTAFHPPPHGQWGITVTGIWSPEKEIAEYLPSLLRMAESYQSNERFAEDYVRRGLENLRRMTRETSEKAARAAREIRESSMAAYQERQRSMEYID